VVVPSTLPSGANARPSGFGSYQPLIDRREWVKRAYLMLDSASTTEIKRRHALNATEQTRDLVKAKAAERDAAMAACKMDEVAKLSADLSFLIGLLEFIQMQLSKFIAIKNFFNTEKENVQKEYEEKIKAPRWYDLVQKYLPWLAGIGAAVGAADIIGKDIWNGIIDLAKSYLPLGIQKYAHDAVNLLGVAGMGWVIIRFNKAAERKKARLGQECFERKKAIDAKEDDIRKKIIELAMTEYVILARQYGFAVEDVETVDEHAKAKSILHSVKMRYGFTLPYPHPADMETNGNGLQKNRIGTFWKGIRKAFSGLFSQHDAPVDMGVLEHIHAPRAAPY